MKKAILAIALGLTVSSVYATNENNGSVHHNTTNNNSGGTASSENTNSIINTNSNEAIGKAHSNSSSHSDSNSSATQSQNASADNNNTVHGSQAGSNSGGNNMSTSYLNQRQHHNTPSMPLFVPGPTATCMATIGGAGAGAGFGFSISGTYRSMHCEKVELAKSFNQMGQTEAALQVLCNVDSDHIDNVDLCDEVKQRRAERVASRKSFTNTPPQPIEVETSAEVANNGLFRFDTQSKQWVYAGGSFFNR